MPDLATTLRAAITKDTRSLRKIAEAAAVPVMTVSDFMRGSEIGVDKAGRLCQVLGLRLTRGRKSA